MEMGHPANNDALSKALNMLKRLRRLNGTALISSGVLLHDDVPDGRNGSGADFAREVNSLFDSCVAEDKDVRQVLLGFDGGNVLLFNAYPVALALFFGDLGVIDSVEKSGKQFLNQFHGALGIQSSKPIRTSALTGAVDKKPATGVIQTDPDPEDIPTVTVAAETHAGGEDPATAWATFNAKLEVLFTKVLGSAQANRLIQRELKSMGISDGEFLMKTQFRAFGLKITQKVRDRSIRKQLELELTDILSADE